jgi:hypothetical protein
VAEEQKKKAEQLGWIQMRSIHPPHSIYYYHPVTKKSFYEQQWEDYLAGTFQPPPCKEVTKKKKLP